MRERLSRGTNSGLRFAPSGLRTALQRPLQNLMPSVPGLVAFLDYPDRLPSIRLYGYMDATMKTTIEVPDELYRRAKAEAALRGRKFRDLVEEGLRLVLEAPRNRRRHSSLAGLTKRACGMIDSGVPDLASNPKHLVGFGRDDRSHR